ncbi:comE: comEA protein [Tepidimonas alkaliphilus]|uniref:ComE: comEA protein n=1 Tax=Tepidimonas alkaliphilus TaxID=2588942 RepID=A0A554W9D1_9BURK|nr:helix-hairpin-helix domain-containing protein [Tepidimonas alkaliphilus]TSE20178.1 comE: comEA protein [Tepidimonas alkaliphilus]
MKAVVRRGVAAAIAVALLGWAGGARSQVEANRASAAELQTVRGIGPVLAARIVEARAQRPFASWADFEQRVPGVGVKTAQKLSLHGLRIDGRSYGAEAARHAGPAVPQPLPSPSTRVTDEAAASPKAAPPPARRGPAPPPHAYPAIPGLSQPHAAAQ